MIKAKNFKLKIVKTLKSVTKTKKLLIFMIFQQKTERLARKVIFNRQKMVNH